MRAFFQFPEDIRIGKSGRLARQPVEGAAVSVHHGREIVRALHAPLYFKRIDARLGKFFEMPDEIEVFAVKDIGAARVLFHGAGRAFRPHLVFPAARLHAFAAVGIAPREIIAQKAPPAVRDAHGAVHEGFQLQFGAEIAYLRYFRDGQFAREHDALRALSVPEFRRVFIGGVRLRGKVQFERGRGGPRGCEHARVGHERCVGADFA